MEFSLFLDGARSMLCRRLQGFRHVSFATAIAMQCVIDELLKIFTDACCAHEYYSSYFIAVRDVTVDVILGTWGFQGRFSVRLMPPDGTRSAPPHYVPMRFLVAAPHAILVVAVDTGHSPARVKYAHYIRICSISSIGARWLSA